MRKLLERLIRSKYDFTFRQLFILDACRTDTQTVRALADAMKVAKPAVSRGIDKLETAGFLRRVADKVDRRSVNIVATPVGRKFMEALDKDLGSVKAHAEAV